MPNIVSRNKVMSNQYQTEEYRTLQHQTLLHRTLLHRTLLESAVWQSDKQVESLTGTEQEWLLCADSLTAKLKQNCREFSVKLLCQQWVTQLTDNESAVLAPDQRYFIREVFLYGDQQAWVFARTVMPEQICRRFPQLMALAEKPLGEFLFEQKLERSGLQWSKIGQLAARRSLFTAESSSANSPDSLLVTELFLEDFNLL